MAESVTFLPIGRVENSFDAPTTPEIIAEGESRIVVDPALLPGLTGLEAGDRILVVFWFHKSQPILRGCSGSAMEIDRDKLLQHPRGDSSRPRRGVFDLRTPVRPNPIGVTNVEILDIGGHEMRVRGLDALNGSPVLDIKPVR